MTNGLYHVIKTCFAASLLFGYMSSPAQHVRRSEFNFRNDNDLYLFNKQDQYYTNGLFFDIHIAADSTSLAPNEANRLWSLTIGQQMYNAYTAQIHHIEEVDRPITAYLFLTAGIDRYFVNEAFVSFVGEIGTIGRRALGQQFQESIHKVLNLYDIAGWEYQLENAFGADASVRYGGLLYRNRQQWFDLSAQAKATLGLNHTGLSIMPTLRWGKLNPLHQSASASSRLQAAAKPIGEEWFLYYSPQLNFVGYDATLQGGMFLRNKGPVTHAPARWVLYNQFGVLYAQHAITLRLQYIFYTKEVPGMFFRHRYGSVGISYQF
ncbi:lipid A-modifier LpxR family protein [Parapedobacter sp. DT-150]|uniref:lipid A-modifier LpxR family protein n=1 Tax=Parapedobacter sp. DT-150 TaxID=3396162 RepID=UPI003F1A4E4D